uniref:GSVIVT01012776001, DGK n=1 Tax=Arundo donax TaxID=35708 RepID=A0A0A8ZMW9_ARUDO
MTRKPITGKSCFLTAGVYSSEMTVIYLNLVSNH